MSVSGYRLTGWLYWLGVDLRAGFRVPRSVSPADSARVRLGLAVTYLDWVLSILESAPDYVDDPAEVRAYRLAAIHDVTGAAQRAAHLITGPRLTPAPDDTLAGAIGTVAAAPLDHRGIALHLHALTRPAERSAATVTVVAPIGSYADVVGDVRFVHGVAETADENTLSYFERHGYELIRSEVAACTSER